MLVLAVIYLLQDTVSGILWFQESASHPVEEVGCRKNTALSHRLQLVEGTNALRLLQIM